MFKCSQSVNYALDGFFGVYVVYGVLVAYRLMQRPQVIRSGKQGSLFILFASCEGENNRYLAVCAQPLGLPGENEEYEQGAVYRLEFSFNGPFRLGTAVKESDSLISFLETFAKAVTCGRLTTRLMPSSHHSFSLDLFTLKGPCRESDGINVEINYIQHDTIDVEFGFAYTIALWTEGLDYSVQLISRHWTFTDRDWSTQRVNGAGVIGKYPILRPDGSYAEMVERVGSSDELYETFDPNDPVNVREYRRELVGGPFRYQSCTGSLTTAKMNGFLRFRKFNDATKSWEGNVIDAFIPEVVFCGESYNQTDLPPPSTFLPWGDHKLLKGKSLFHENI